MSVGVQLPGVGGSRDPGDSARVREFVRAAVPDPDGTILITELTCTEPGCPPTETVIALMHPGAPQQFKIRRPLREVTEADVAEVLGGAGEAHTHPAT